MFVTIGHSFDPDFVTGSQRNANDTAASRGIRANFRRRQLFAGNPLINQLVDDEYAKF
jgi:hypothetical protein